MVSDTSVRTGQCHCGAVRFEATLSDGFNSIRRCTCSYCRMRGAVVVMAEMGGIKLLQGEDALASYRFHTGTAQHFFCSRCGIYTHHQRRSNQNLYAVNVACLDGVSPFDFSEVPVMDGVNHTNDTGRPTRRACLRGQPRRKLNAVDRAIVCEAQFDRRVAHGGGVGHLNDAGRQLGRAVDGECERHAAAGHVDETFGPLRAGIQSLADGPRAARTSVRG